MCRWYLFGIVELCVVYVHVGEIKGEREREGLGLHGLCDACEVAGGHRCDVSHTHTHTDTHKYENTLTHRIYTCTLINKNMHTNAHTRKHTQI